MTRPQSGSRCRDSLRSTACKSDNSGHYRPDFTASWSSRCCGSTRLSAAGQLDAAVEPLFVAAEEAARRAEFERALALDDRRRDVLQALGAEEDEPRWVHGELRRTRTLMLLGKFDEATELIDAAAESIDRNGDVRCRADLHQTRAALARYENDTNSGIAHSRAALELLQELGDQTLAARSHRRLGELLRRSGDPDGSIAHYAKAIDMLQTVGDPFDLAWAYLGLGTSERHAGRIDVAGPHIERALEMFASTGSRIGLGNSYNELGEFEISRGNYEAAERHYRKVLETWRNRPHTQLFLVRYNIAMTLLPRQRWTDALLLLDGVLEVARERESRALLMFASSAMAACLAGLQEFQRAKKQYDTFATLADELNIYEPAIGEAMVIYAGELPADENSLARAALRRARHQYEMLGNESAMKSVDQLLNERS